MANDEHEQRKKMYRRRRGRQHSSAARDPVEDEVLTTNTESGAEDDIYQHPMIVGPRNDEPLPPMNNLLGSEEHNNQEKCKFQCIALLLCIVVILAIYVTLGIGEHYYFFTTSELTGKGMSSPSIVVRIKTAPEKAFLTT
ncbi:hypothetical protein PIB30_067617 [Stylosanthes scabra]|uniref:Uncharacterized protein n=1 Tax=Stylosanthes scabra TaxID=79078 RepID=A0ABU6SNB7_9FABA|nr:hypothetical protein [Stylosanthes scabra]